MRPGDKAGALSFGIRDMQLGDNPMPVCDFACPAIGERRQPHPAFCAELFDAGLSEVQRRPPSLGENVAPNKAIVVRLGERLVTEQRQRAFRRSPVAACLLGPQSTNRARLRIEREHEVGGFNLRPGLVGIEAGVFRFGRLQSVNAFAGLATQRFGKVRNSLVDVIAFLGPTGFRPAELWLIDRFRQVLRRVVVIVFKPFRIDAPSMLRCQEDPP